MPSFEGKLMGVLNCENSWMLNLQDLNSGALELQYLNNNNKN
jgi:hypothetical protein